MLIPTMRLRAEIAPLLPAIAAVVIASGLFFGGYDSPLGQSLSALLNSLLLAIVLLLLPPAPPQFWKGVAAPLACFAGALAWLAMVAVNLLLGMGVSLVPAAEPITTAVSSLMGSLLIAPMLTVPVLAWLRINRATG